MKTVLGILFTLSVPAAAIMFIVCATVVALCLVPVVGSVVFTLVVSFVAKVGVWG